MAHHKNTAAWIPNGDGGLVTGIQRTIDQHARQGWRLVTIFPVTETVTSKEVLSNATGQGFMGMSSYPHCAVGYSHSYTSGVVAIFESESGQ